MRENISPEERLLRLVKQGAKKPGSTPPPTPAATPASAPLPLSSSAKTPASTRGTFKRLFSLHSLSNLLLFVLFLSLTGLALNLIMPRKMNKREALPVLSREKEMIKEKDLILKMKPYDYYAQQIGKRVLFAPGIGKKKKGTFGAKSLNLQEIMQNFTLIGIKMGENPQAIIEDKKAKKTYFLKRGDYLGEIEIGDIQKGKVILEYQGESFDLFL